MLLIDGDFVSPTWVARLRGLVRTLLRAGASTDVLSLRHRDILSRVHFSQGARAEEVASLLEQADFTIESVDTNLRAIHRAQGRQMTLDRRLERGAQHRYAIRACR